MGLVEDYDMLSSWNGNRFELYFATGGEHFRLLLQVMNAFHRQKKQRGVDEMLLRLYNPILWRALTVRKQYYQLPGECPSV